MDISIFLAKAFGLYMLIMGVALVLRKENFTGIVSDSTEDETYRFMLSIITTIVGILLVISHNIWSGPGWVILITVMSWLILLKGISRIFLSDDQFENLTGWVGPVTYLWIGVLSIVLGIYLAYIGFAL
ncbi:MAG TPA: hypothetical protein QGH03_01480 [Candidatus Paceibacterota bacterium]|jgi:hypothetical protein|nr:hypothetical protein [Parcubacteria group bacterium]MDP6119515.1 hypothetical protein [Candidatus Paceibacterota bacterium]HJN62885.1 hypothetical protein [Candidatus Paceibacterota bacterium]|tara:strand:+ start:765 stop:1151 length:387 start_codon:yes stop_codon:yes gene_type:complete